MLLKLLIKLGIIFYYNIKVIVFNDITIIKSLKALILKV
jgi:hypothetical protein